MSMVIGTNLASLSAQRALGEAQSAQQTAMERLSTGKRINSAADDAAGLFLVEHFVQWCDQRSISQGIFLKLHLL